MAEDEFYNRAQVAVVRKTLKARLVPYWFLLIFFVGWFWARFFLIFGELGATTKFRFSVCWEPTLSICGAGVIAYMIYRTYKFIEDMEQMPVQRLTLQIEDPGVGQSDVAAVTVKYQGVPYVLPLEFRKTFPFGHPTEVCYCKTLGPVPYPPHIIVSFESPEQRF
ncbi:MAG: hypothetical protein HYZ53_00355 [Planctomycetes bacterium]|nr:hypothetical protein [Planctomycetota bacterium]